MIERAIAYQEDRAEEAWDDASLEERFYRLYRDLADAFPHPLEWLGLLRRPPWWRFRARAAHSRVVTIFAKHGVILRDSDADDWRRTRPQRHDEDCGGAMVRRMREVWQHQSGVPYSAPRHKK